jgi:hypothetical protein
MAVQTLLGAPNISTLFKYLQFGAFYTGNFVQATSEGTKDENLRLE